MSIVAARPSSTTNSFYESEGRPSIDSRHPEAANKTKALVRAIGREQEAHAPSFRPPSSWTQHSGHHQVVWTGEIGDDADAQEDQFSDAESWDGETQASPRPAAIREHDNAANIFTTSVYGEVRPTSIGSSIFAGRGAKSERRQRGPPPPLPTQASQYLGSDPATLLSPSSQDMLSPHSDASGFESGSQYSQFDSRDDDFVKGVDMQTAKTQATSPRFAQDDNTRFQMASGSLTQLVPPRNPSRNPPPIPTKSPSRSDSSDSIHRGEIASDAERPSRGPATLADGTLVPKMPPVPQTTDLSRPRKVKPRRERSSVLSFDGGAAEEEKMLVELQNKLAKDASRVSTLGPKLKKNAPAPWELGGEDEVTSPSRPSLRDQLRPTADTFEKPFSKFRSKASVDSSHAAPRSPNSAVPLPLAHSSTMASVASIEHETQREDDTQSLFATQRSRSKGVSSTAVGMLKGLGLAGAAAPASKKGKLTKALRLVGAGASANDTRRPRAPPSVPFSELSASSNYNQAGTGPMSSPSFAPSQEFGGFVQSYSSRTINGNMVAATSDKSHSDYASMTISTNADLQDRTRSPPLPSPRSAYGTLPSPRMGGVRSLAYKKDTLNPTHGFPNHADQRSDSLERLRPRTPPVRTASIGAHSDNATEDGSATRVSSIDGALGLRAISAEGESTPVRNDTTEAAAMHRKPSSSSSNAHTHGMSVSSSQTSGSLPLPGNIEGVPYKLISLEEAREQARQKQSEWLAASGHRIPASGEPYHDEVGMQRENSYDNGSSMRFMKKSGFLMRKLKKEKGVNGEMDGVSTLPSMASNMDMARPAKSPPMPSFSFTGLDEDGEKAMDFNEKPALQIRPVSSMFSGFSPDFLDAAALSEGHGREASNGSTSSSGGLLAPVSPVTSSFRTPSPSTFDTGRFAPSPSSPSKPDLAAIRATSHGTALPGPPVPGSADSTWSNTGGPNGDGRLPSLDAGGSTSDTSQFHSPLNSPLTPSFHHSVHPPSITSPGVETAESDSGVTPPASPHISEEVRQRARDIDAQIQELSNELNELRLKHVGQGTAPSQKAGEGGIVDCPYCGCGCAEQRRMKSINEAAVLKGVSVLDRGRALKPSPNVGNPGKFGGYTYR